MTDLVNSYFSWLSLIVTNDPVSKRDSYSMLLRYLFNTKFFFLNSSDVDRAIDGIYLRKMFIADRVQFYGLDNQEFYRLNADLGDCRILEMMIGLARRCEMDTMYNNILGDRTGQWFWEMIASLKLGQMTDACFDQEYVESRVMNFMNRNYKVNGEGGLFTVNNVTDDMRRISICKQMNLYLNEVLLDEGLLHHL